MARGRGGKRTPDKPAAVSTPQSGQRTDGGPGSRRQPLRAPTGMPYGEHGRLLDQQRSAPLPDDGTPGVPASPLGGRPVPDLPAAFGPTNRPLEPGTAGARPITAPQELPAKEVLRSMFAKRPSPWIARLLDGMD